MVCKKEKKAAIKHDLCAMHHNECNKRLRLGGILQQPLSATLMCAETTPEREPPAPFSHQPPIIRLIGPLFYVCFYCTLHK